jgi:EAL domain-containing protein (putative c-di-GMP-specific phosphodiesterase class I)/CheY-like chemotaxis protein
MKPAIGTKILCVEDEPIVRLALARQLNRIGFLVDVAGSGAEALHLLSAHAYPLVVTDLHMPDIGGLQLIERARALTPHTQFIVITGMQQIDLGADSIAGDSLVALLPKPLDMDALTSAIDRALRRHSAVAELRPTAGAVVLIRDAVLRTSMERQLSARYAVKVAASLEEAIASMEARPDLLVTDVASAVPPRFTGLTRLHHLSPKTAIVLVAEERFEVLARQSLAYGASDYCFTSEVCESTFARTVRHAIERATAGAVVLDAGEIDSERASFEAELRQALVTGRFALHYQPQRDLRSGTVRGAEALLRLTREDGTLVRPDQFLPVLESSDLMLDVGAWVLETACRKAAEWHRAGRSDMRIAVNLSLRQFERPGLVQAVVEAAGTAGIDPSALELEITESVLMQDTELAAATLQALEQTGARIAIDDFGTAGSSLAHLTRFRVDAVKIDRCFVSTIGSGESGGSIASAIIGLAHRLGLEVVGEGVETPDELAFLRSEGCDIVQGFLLGRPTESWSPRSARAGMGAL